MEQSSLTFFYKIHSGTVSLDKDKILTPVPNLKRTRASHDSQYTRYFAYCDALKNSVFPRTVLRWSPPRPLRTHLDYWSRGMCFCMPLIYFL